MPTVLRVGPYRFFFWADERQEPPHIHVSSAENEAKFWLRPIDLSWNEGFRSGELKEIEGLINANLNLLLEAWMSSFVLDGDQVPVDVQVDDHMIRVRFNGGLELATPVSRFPRLQHAEPAARNNWKLVGRGFGIHWPEIDEDISVRGLFDTVRKMPEPAMEQVPVLISDLIKTAGRLNTLFPGRPFTPDGHLVGSIGEVVAEYIYDLKLEPCSNPGFDARTADGRHTVEIKLTGEKGRSFNIRWQGSKDATVPDLLLCLKLGPDGFQEIYNGEFPLALLADKKIQNNGQVSLSLASLKERNPELLPKKRSFDSINRWFTPELSNVA